MKEKIFSRIKSMKREQMIIFLLLFGIVIVISIPVNKNKKTKNLAEKDDATAEAQEVREVHSDTQQLEKMLEDTLQKVSGVGTVSVAITMETTGEKIVEKDIPENNSKSIQEDSQGGKQESVVQSGEESTVYSKDSQGNQTPYVISEKAPEIRGVIVVAKGGEDPVVAQQIQEAVMALFHVEAHKIKVMKMK